MNILHDLRWRSVLSDLFVEFGGAWLAVIVVAPVFVDSPQLVADLLISGAFGILSLVIAHNLRD